MACDCRSSLDLHVAAKRRLEYLCRKKTRFPVQELLVDVLMQTTKFIANRAAFEELLSACVASTERCDHSQSPAPKLSNEADADVAFCSTAAPVLVVDDKWEGMPTPHECSAGARDEFTTAGRLDRACVDPGTQLTVIGDSQARAYAQEFAVHPRSRASMRAFKFGNVRHSGLGVIDIDMPVSESHSLVLSAEIVDVIVPLLLRLDDLSGIRAVLDFAEDAHVGKFDEGRLPLVREKEHIYLGWGASILYTPTELKRMHRHFKHPSAERVYALVRRADSLGCCPRLLYDLEDVTHK